jgi:hypothetical protein
MCCIAWKNQGAFLVLKVDDSMRVVGGRINHVTCNLFDCAVLTVSPFGNNIVAESRQFRFPFFD